MNIDIWRNRAKNRSDMTIGLIHLTRGENDDQAFGHLWKILEGRKLIGGHGYVNGDDAVCCFQEVPPFSIAENLNYERLLHSVNARYSPFGIRVIKGNLFQAGGRPVIYGKTDELKKVLKEEDYWRIVDLDYSDQNNIVDWTHEREWRIKGDYSFQYDEIEVIVRDGSYYKRFVEKCLDEKQDIILRTINGIISLNSLYC